MKAFTPDNSLAVANGASPIPATGGATRRLPPNLSMEERDIGPVPTDTGLMPWPNVIAPPQGPRTDLASLRQQYPFVPIMPFPSIVRGVVLDANVAQDIQFPTGGCVFILAANGDFYANMQGRATIPAIANTNDNGSIFAPTFSWFFTKSNMLSVIAPNANTYVQACIYVPTDLPNFG